VIVKCGRCQTAFEVDGAGRFPCPSCGTANDVRSAANAPADRDLLTPPPPPAPEPPSPRVVCGECELSFIVGSVAEAQCPNCGATVAVADSGSNT